MNGYGLDVALKQAPDEFYDWVKEVAFRLILARDKIKSIAEKDKIELLRMKSAGSTRHEIYLVAKEMKYPAISLSLFDEKMCDEKLWKMVRPVGSHLFKKDIDL
jgi:hypothetical protein